VGKHRRISAAPSSPCAANAGVRSTAPRHPEIDRPVDPSPRAVKGAKAQAPLRALWSRVRRGSSPGPRRPFFRERDVAAMSRPGRNVHRAPRGLDIPDSYAGATLPSPGCPLNSGTSLTTSDAWSSIQLSKNVCREAAHDPGIDDRRRTVPLACDATVDCGQRLLNGPPHHPPTPPTETSRSALAKSNNSDMAAQTRSRPTTQGSTTPVPSPATNRGFKTNEGRAGLNPTTTNGRQAKQPKITSNQFSVANFL
jgi:hypothetical protein